MKLYIHNRKVGDTYEKAMTVYSNKGRLLYSATGRITEEDMQKFDMGLYAIEWALKKFRTEAQNGNLNEKEPVTIYICSKTIYNWLRNESCPYSYVKTFSNIEMELSLMLNPAEIIYSKNTKVKYKKLSNDLTPVSTMFDNID